MKSLIDKSMMNATEKSDNFKKFLKNKRENSLNLIKFKATLLQRRRTEYKAPWNNPPSMGNTKALINKASYKKIIKIMKILSRDSSNPVDKLKLNTRMNSVITLSWDLQMTCFKNRN
jgi:hypothetical protein